MVTRLSTRECCRHRYAPTTLHRVGDSTSPNVWLISPTSGTQGSFAKCDDVSPIRWCVKVFSSFDSMVRFVDLSSPFLVVFCSGELTNQPTNELTPQWTHSWLSGCCVPTKFIRPFGFERGLASSFPVLLLVTDNAMPLKMQCRRQR